MTDVSLGPAGGQIACAHCGHLDSGTYCSGCGKELAPTHRHTVAEAWEHIVVDRLQDLRAFLVTTWWLVRRPRAFFRTVMTGPAQRAGHVFPEPVPQAFPYGVLQTPVKYLIFAFVAYVLAAKASGTGIEELIPGLGGLAEDLNTEVTLLLLMAWIAFYGLAFHRGAARRISVEEAAVLNAYLFGANLLVTAASMLTPERWTLAILAEAVLFIHVGVVLPYVVLPALYALSRRRVFVAQLVAFAGAAVLMVLLFVGVGSLVALVRQVAG